MNILKTGNNFYLVHSRTILQPPAVTKYWATTHVANIEKIETLYNRKSPVASLLRSWHTILNHWISIIQEVSVQTNFIFTYKNFSSNLHHCPSTLHFPQVPRRFRMTACKLHSHLCQKFHILRQRKSEMHAVQSRHMLVTSCLFLNQGILLAGNPSKNRCETPPVSRLSIDAAFHCNC